MLGRPRTVLLAMALLVVPALGGCGADDGEDRERVEAVADDALAAVDGVLHELADDVRMRFNQGNHFYSLCGDDLAPGGVVHTVIANFGSSELVDEKAADRAADVLSADGWTVERPDNPRIAIGTKADNTLRVEFGPGAVVVQVVSDCVETSDEIARDYAEKSDEDIVWK